MAHDGRLNARGQESFIILKKSASFIIPAIRLLDQGTYIVVFGVYRKVTLRAKSKITHTPSK